MTDRERWQAVKDASEQIDTYLMVPVDTILETIAACTVLSTATQELAIRLNCTEAEAHKLIVAYEGGKVR